MSKISASLVSEENLVNELRELVKQNGGQVRLAAKALGIHESHLGRILSGQRPISTKMAAKLGYGKITAFTKKED